MITSSRLHLAVLAAGLSLAGLCVPAAAFSLEAGLREVPAKEIPVPTAGVSPQEQAVIGAALPPYWNDHPADAAAWKALIKMRQDAVEQTLPDLKARLGVKVEQVKVGGVNAYMVAPNDLPAANKDRLLVHVHGGGYVYTTQATAA